MNIELEETVSCMLDMIHALIIAKDGLIVSSLISRKTGESVMLTVGETVGCASVCVANNLINRLSPIDCQ